MSWGKGMFDEDVIICRQCMLENAAGEELPDVLEAFERGVEDGRSRLRPFPFRMSPYLQNLSLAYANGFALGRLSPNPN